MRMASMLPVCCGTCGINFRRYLTTSYIVIYVIVLLTLIIILWNDTTSHQFPINEYKTLRDSNFQAKIPVVFYSEYSKRTLSAKVRSGLLGQNSLSGYSADEGERSVTDENYYLYRPSG
jgi:hypothetical protein